MTIKTLSLLVLALLLATGARAQFTLRGSISGVVTDPSDSVVPNVAVTLNDLDRNQVYTAQTNETGVYAFNNLTPGRYQATVQRQGFLKLVSAVVTVSTQQGVRVDLRLQVGQVAESIEVTAAVSLLQTEQSVVGQVVQRDLIELLPTVGRNFTGLGVLSTGLTSFPRNDSGSTWQVGAHGAIGGVDYAPGGGGDIGFYMNGMNINENYMGGASYSPSIEAVSEVKVDAANFSAASGRDISTFTITTRGGTNRFHGAIYDNLQNSALKAWDAYSKTEMAPGQQKTVMQRNQFGANFGGPVLLPKLFNGRDKLFFFVNYEGTIERSAASDATYRVPTDAERRGDFSALLTRFPGDPSYILYDPYSTVVDSAGASRRTAFPNNVVTPINANAQQILGLYPQPNGYTNPSNPGDLKNYRANRRGGFHTWRFDTRVDYRITQNDNVYVTLSKSHGLTDNKGGLFPQYISNPEDWSQNITVNYARVFSPSFTNELIFAQGGGKMFNYDTSIRDYLGEENSLRTKFFKNYSSSRVPGLFSIGVGGYTSIGVGGIWRDENPTWQVSDNASWVKGSHSLKMGFNYFWKQEFDWMDSRSVTFNSQFTRAGSLGGRLGGDGVASLLLGIPSSMNQQYEFIGGYPDQINNMVYWGAYLEDKWSISNRLTLSLGLRYDLPIPLYSANKYGNAAIDLSYPGWQLAIPGIAEGYDQHSLVSG